MAPLHHIVLEHPLGQLGRLDAVCVGQHQQRRVDEILRKFREERNEQIRRNYTPDTVYSVDAVGVKSHLQMAAGVVM